MIENEQVQEHFMMMEDKLEKSISVLKEDYSSIRAGRANPHILDKILVDYYGTMSPINQVGNIAVSDAKCLVISPWDTSLLKNIEKSISQANLGINPTNDGKVIRLVFPDLTEERRKDIVKTVKKMGEDAKVVQRNIRRDCLEVFKKLKTNKEISEDDYSSCEKDVEKLITKYMDSLNTIIAEKEKEIMSI